MLTQLNIRGRLTDGQFLSSVYFLSGGYGTFKDWNGRSALLGPSNMIVAPVEIWEAKNNIPILKMELLVNSSGPGRNRGGPGQEVILRNDTGSPLNMVVFSSRFYTINRHRLHFSARVADPQNNRSKAIPRDPSTTRR